MHPWGFGVEKWVGIPIPVTELSHGEGTYTFSDGRVFEGEFAINIPNSEYLFAANQGDVKTQFNLGVCYYIQKAIQRSVNQGDVKAAA